MADTQALRIAVEGCGHGTLDAIYASVEKSCEVKGWDGVDLLIICGDFQAVRSHQDLNVTAMPAKYRKMGDFHQYYYGTREAPYLTIFIGGNHEASNHLFELHYGGWAAPNIYYLGAANVIRFGTITIAGTSGVYKKYDYRRPHFERLPYNSSDIKSIYHQRELDIRKLLSYRSQIDIGLSHDWPTGMEWLGDHKALFARKRYLRAEAEAGDLGSMPSSLVLDRLRPPYWFSAHHHYRYVAYKTHGITETKQQTDNIAVKPGVGRQSPRKVVEVYKKQTTRNLGQEAQAPTQAHVQKENKSELWVEASTQNDPVSAWNSFKNVVEEQDAADEARDEIALRQRAKEQERTGKHAVAGYNFEEDFKEVSITKSSDGQHRTSRSPEKRISQQIPQVDGTCCSLPKRRRKSSPSDDSQPYPRARHGDQFDGSASGTTVTVLTNPDAIDIDMSDSDSDNDQRALVTQPQETAGQTEEGEESEETARNNEARKDVKEDPNSAEPVGSTKETRRLQSSHRVSSRGSPPMPPIQEVESHESLLITNPFLDSPAVQSSSTVRLYQGSGSLNATNNTAAAPNGKYHGNQSRSNGSLAQRVSHRIDPSSTFDGHIVDSSVDSIDGGVKLEKQADSDGASEADEEKYGDLEANRPQHNTTMDTSRNDPEIPDDIRAQLAEMSSTFAPEEKFTKSPDLPFPEGISNKTTRFLALSKVEKGSANDFLQLLEIAPYDVKETKTPKLRTRPYELEYDPEWLAITRVFAAELQLGGSSRDKVPAHQGETFYRERILEEEQWIDENIVSKGLLIVPKNFVVQTEQKDYNTLSNKEKAEMPRELSNPQTSQFCDLVGIANPFDISEDERNARMEQGPARDEWQQRGGNNRGRGGHRGSRGGRGGRGRGGGGYRGGGRGSNY